MTFDNTRSFSIESGVNKLELPKEAEVLCLQASVKANAPYCFVHVRMDPLAPTVIRKFWFIMAGDRVPPIALYAGSLERSGGMWHLFEELPLPKRGRDDPLDEAMPKLPSPKAHD